MEPIDDWLEDELKRNDMHRRKVNIGAAQVTLTQRQGGLGVPLDYQPPLKASIPPYPTKGGWQHPEDAYEVPTHMATGELYSPPSRYTETASGSDLAAKIGNMLESVEQLPKDMVSLPEHYARFTIEPIRFVVENDLNWFQANIIKYIMRYDAKNGMEDLKKAQRYLTMFIKWVDGDPDWWRR